MPNHRWIPALALGLCFLSLTVGAQTAARARANFTVEHWPSSSGLRSSAVIAITQTRDGYLWLGTYKGGLVRFDGIRFEPFNDADIPELDSSTIVFLFEDSQSGLWVGTDTGGTVLIKNGKVTPFEFGGHSREGRLVGACEDASGNVWLCTANGQLCRYRDGQVDVWSSPGLSNARRLIAEKSGPLWVATGQSLVAFDPATIVSKQNLPGPALLSPLSQFDFLLAGSRGGFWLLANGKVQNPRTQRDFGFYPWAGAPVLSACEDHEGNLIVGTQDHGLTWFDADGRAEMLTKATGLSHDTVLSLCMDREGSLWVGTDGGGLNRVKRNVFDVATNSLGKVVQSVCEDSRNGLWYGINFDPVKYWKDGVLKEFGTAQGLLNLNVRAVLVDRNQKVWVGTYGGGIFQLENDSFQPAPGASAIHTNISALFEDRAGRIWAGTEGGLACWDGRAWTNYTTTNSKLSANAVRAIAEVAQGNLWIGTERGGLNCLRDGQFTVYPKEAGGLPNSSVSALLADRDGVLWIGTPGSGLVRFQNGKWTRYRARDGLSGISVSYLLEDGEGFLWIGANTGLMRVPKKELNDYAHDLIPSVSSRVYGEADGMPTGECTAGSQPAAWRTRGNQLWFATTKGLVSVNPAHLQRNTNQPPVLIEAIFVDDELQNTNRLRFNWPKQLTIPPGKEVLEIHYTSPNVLVPTSARFKYQMEGYQEKWTDAADSRVVRFPKLPPGDYRFHVKAGNEDGVWNETGAVLDILVEPQFWQTWWFRSLAIAALVGAIVGAVYFVSTQKLQRQLAVLKQQEALEKERARIARDLHDQLGANLTQVALLGEMVESDKDQPDEVEAHAKQISQTARGTALALDEIVWAANPSNDTLDSLATYACKYAQEYLAVAGLSYRFEAPENLPATPIPPDVRHHIFLAFKEAVNNVVKHSQATAVKVRLRLTGNRFTLEIEDNGRGLPDDAAIKGRNGLRNMRKRMEDVGGTFSVEPAPERGTLVRLTVPLGNNTT